MARCIRGNGIGTILAGALGTFGPVSAPVLVPLLGWAGLTLVFWPGNRFLQYPRADSVCVAPVRALLRDPR